MEIIVDEVMAICRENKIKITQLSRYLSCSRASVYNWAKGGDMIDVYRYKMLELHRILTEAKDKHQAFMDAYKTR